MIVSDRFLTEVNLKVVAIVDLHTSVCGCHKLEIVFQYIQGAIKVVNQSYECNAGAKCAVADVLPCRNAYFVWNLLQ